MMAFLKIKKLFRRKKMKPTDIYPHGTLFDEESFGLMFVYLQIPVMLLGLLIPFLMFPFGLLLPFDIGFFTAFLLYRFVFKSMILKGTITPYFRQSYQQSSHITLYQVLIHGSVYRVSLFVLGALYDVFFKGGSLLELPMLLIELGVLWKAPLGLGLSAFLIYQLFFKEKHVSVMAYRDMMQEIMKLKNIGHDRQAYDFMVFYMHGQNKEKGMPYTPQDIKRQVHVLVHEQGYELEDAYKDDVVHIYDKREKEDRRQNREPETQVKPKENSTPRIRRRGRVI